MYSVLTKYVHCWLLTCYGISDVQSSVMLQESKRLCILRMLSSFHSNGMQLLLEIIITCVLSERFSYDLRKIETMVTYDKTLELCNMEVRVKDMF